MSRDKRPDPLTRVCLLIAAALPWYAVTSGIFGLYFYVLLLVPQVGRVLGEAAVTAVSEFLFFAAQMAALPLGLLLLVAMPAGLVFAVFRHPPVGLAGGTVRAGCVVSMVFAVLYSAIIIVAWVTGLTHRFCCSVWHRQGEAGPGCDGPEGATTRKCPTEAEPLRLNAHQATLLRNCEKAY